jgi:plastocyanin
MQCQGSLEVSGMQVGRKTAGAAALLAAAAGALALVTGAGASRAHASAVTVLTKGGNKFTNSTDPPNKLLVLDARFAPGAITVKRGQTVTWRDKDKERDEPHTITISTKRDLPKTPSSQCKGCSFAIGHFNDPNDLSKGVKAQVLNKGPVGLDEEGDSLFLGLGGKASAKISAKRGTTLYYICAIHSWMRGQINVK